MEVESTVVRSAVTLDEFLRMQETKPYSEFGNGVVFQKAGGDWPHSAIQTFLMVVLFQFLASTGIGRVFPELRCIFGPPGRERAYVPDIVVIAKEHLTGGRYPRTAPDLAVEIMSPDQDMARISDKIQFYFSTACASSWLSIPRRAP